MLKRTFRIYALSLAGGALLLGGASVAATAMTHPESLPGVATEQSTTAIFTDGADAAKISSKFGGAAVAGAGIAAGVGIVAGAGTAVGGATGTRMLAAVGNAVRRSPKPCDAE